MIKIRYQIIDLNAANKKRKKPIRKGYCKLCGSKLTSEKSIERGIGQRCLGRHCAIILEIVPEQE